LILSAFAEETASVLVLIALASTTVLDVLPVDVLEDLLACLLLPDFSLFVFDDFGRSGVSASPLLEEDLSALPEPSFSALASTVVDDLEGSFFSVLLDGAFSSVPFELPFPEEAVL